MVRNVGPAMAWIPGVAAYLPMRGCHMESELDVPECSVLLSPEPLEKEARDPKPVPEPELMVSYVGRTPVQEYR